MTKNKFTKKQLDDKIEDLLSKHDRAIEKGHYKRAENHLKQINKLRRIKI